MVKKNMKKGSVSRAKKKQERLKQSIATLKRALAQSE